MSHHQRKQVAYEAAKLLYLRDETEYHRAKTRAAWQVYQAEFRPSDLPSNREVREQVLEFARAERRELTPEGRGFSPPSLDPGAVRPRFAEVDRFQAYALLLAPLEKIKEDRATHPEGDLLYHSLQVFALARQERPYDEEFLLAALLHEVGRAIDPREPAAAGLEALEGLITPRTAWLIEHLEEAHALGDLSLGVRSRRRLQAAEDFDELTLLARCDREGRQVGAAVGDVEDALEYLRDLAASCGE